MIPEASEPGNRAPAPGELRVVQAFVNTVDLEGGRDAFADGESLRSWLVGQQLMDAHSLVGDADLRRALEVREALRDLAQANHDGEADLEAIHTLNRVASTTRLVVCFRPEGRARLEPEIHGVDGALSRILSIVYTSMVDGTWWRFKACRRDTCRWAFYDRSKNRSSSWCSMSVCGNREKAKTYRRRHDPGNGVSGKR